MVRYLKRLKSSRLGRVQAFPMYGGLGMSAPSLHRESTDSLIYIYIFRWYVVPQFSFYASTSFQFSPMCRLLYIYTSIKIIKNEVGCRDDTVPKTVGTRRHCEEK